MDTINFERNGLNISLKILGLNRDNKLKAECTINGAYTLGFFDNKQNAMILLAELKIKEINNKIKGIKLDGEILEHFINVEKTEKENAKKQFDSIVEQLISGIIKIKWYDTTEYFDGYDIPIKKFKINTNIDIPANKSMNDIYEKALEYFGFNCLDTETFIENSLEKEEKNGEMTLETLLKKRINKREEKLNDLNKLIEKAKITGEKQFYRKYTVECNDKNEECDIDIVTEFVDENGKINKIKNHTW